MTTGLFRFSRRESNDLVAPIKSLPSHVGHVAKPCAQCNNLAELRPANPHLLPAPAWIFVLGEGRPLLCLHWQAFNRSRRIARNEGPGAVRR